jgi:hypothetical protein
MKTTFKSPGEKTPSEHNPIRQDDRSAQERFMGEIRDIMSRMYKANLKASRMDRMTLKQRRDSPASITQEKLQKLR